MGAISSEAIVLRTYPLREADLIVSFFTRDKGKLRGVAYGAKKSKNRFGSGLQRLSYVRMYYHHREDRELDTLDACDILQSQFETAASYESAVALDFIAEVSEHLLPPAEVNEKFFRLMLAVTGRLAQAGPAAVWPAVLYFSLWAVRLSGILGPAELSEEERSIAEEMLRTPIGQLSGREWRRETAAGLRHALIGMIEEHVERKLVTVQYLESL